MRRPEVNDYFEGSSINFDKYLQDLDKYIDEVERQRDYWENRFFSVEKQCAELLEEIRR